MDRFLVITISGARYALRLSDIGAVSDPLPVRPVPGSAASVTGLAEWHGRLVTVLDLPRLLGGRSESGDRCLVRLAPPRERIALMVPAPVGIRTSSAVADDEPPDDAMRPRRDDDDWSGDIRILDAEAVIALAEGEVRRSEPAVASGGPWDVQEAGPWT